MDITRFARLRSLRSLTKKKFGTGKQAKERQNSEPARQAKLKNLGQRRQCPRIGNLNLLFANLKIEIR